MLIELCGISIIPLFLKFVNMFIEVLTNYLGRGSKKPSPVGEGGSRRLTDEELVWLLVTVQSIEFVSLNAKIRHAFFETYRILIKLSFSAASPRNNRDLSGSAD